MDDRGVGGSTGEKLQVTLGGLAEDVLLGVKYLKSHERVDPSRIGLLGHSTGAVIPLMGLRT